MGPFAVVVTNPFGHDLAEVSCVQRNHPIEALASDGANDAFAIGIRLKAPAAAFAALEATLT